MKKALQPHARHTLWHQTHTAQAQQIKLHLCTEVIIEYTGESPIRLMCFASTFCTFFMRLHMLTLWI